MATSFSSSPYPAFSSQPTCYQPCSPPPSPTPLPCSCWPTSPSSVLESLVEVATSPAHCLLSEPLTILLHLISHQHCCLVCINCSHYQIPRFRFVCTGNDALGPVHCLRPPWISGSPPLSTNTCHQAMGAIKVFILTEKIYGPPVTAKKMWLANVKLIFTFSLLDHHLLRWTSPRMRRHYLWVKPIRNSDLKQLRLQFSTKCYFISNSRIPSLNAGNLFICWARNIC